MDTSKVQLMEAEQQALADQALSEFAAAYGLDVPPAEAATETPAAPPPARDMGPVKEG